MKCVDVKCLDVKCVDVKCIDVNCVEVKCVVVKCVDVTCVDVKCVDVTCVNVTPTHSNRHTFSQKNNTLLDNFNIIKDVCYAYCQTKENLDMIVSVHL